MRNIFLSHRKATKKHTFGTTRSAKFMVKDTFKM